MQKRGEKKNWQLLARLKFQYQCYYYSNFKIWKPDFNSCLFVCLFSYSGKVIKKNRYSETKSPEHFIFYPQTPRWQFFQQFYLKPMAVPLLLFQYNRKKMLQNVILQLSGYTETPVHICSLWLYEAVYLYVKPAGWYKTSRNLVLQIISGGQATQQQHRG